MTNFINHVTAYVPVLCLALLLTWPGEWSDEPPAGIFGEYTGLGALSKAKGKSGKVYTKKSDRVRISRRSDGHIRVTIILTADKGQVCELESDAVWNKRQLILTADGLDETKPCTLVLLINGPTLTLHDTGGYCREVYCGTRGAFDGAGFHKK